MSEVRLQKYLSSCGVASRRRAEVMIERGKVKVNGAIIKTLGTKVDPDRDQIEVDNKIVRSAEKGVILLHKPRGVLTTLDASETRPTIRQYLTKKTKSYFPVGRLDFDSAGLLILTNDGELAEALTHPRFELKRVYEVKVRGIITDAHCAALAEGITLDDGVARARVKILETGERMSWLEVEVTEGRNRLVRRIFDTLHHPVVKLSRSAHGPVRLGKLPQGTIRTLSEVEYQKLRKAVLG